jgi:hypothetical protein
MECVHLIYVVQDTHQWQALVVNMVMNILVP